MAFDSVSHFLYCLTEKSIHIYALIYIGCKNFDRLLIPAYFAVSRLLVKITMTFLGIFKVVLSNCF